MPWGLYFHPAAKKDLRRLPAAVRDFIIQKIFPLLTGNPYVGKPLHGPLKGLWKYVYGEYRIAFLVDTKRKEVIIIGVGPRGGFYKHLRRRLGK